MGKRAHTEAATATRPDVDDDKASRRCLFSQRDMNMGKNGKRHTK